MSKRTRVRILLFSVVSCLGWTLFLGLKTLEGQMIGPPTACLSTLDGVNVPASVTATLISPPSTNPYWNMVWNWSLVFTCSQANFNMCQECSRIEMDARNSTNTGWVMIAMILSPGAAPGACAQSNTMNYTTTMWVSAFPQGWGYQFVWQTADFDPTDSADCTGQVYQDVATRTFITQ